MFGPTGTKKKSQKGLLKAEAGELELIEIHAKHTLKKFQPGKSKHKNKVCTFSPICCSSYVNISKGVPVVSDFFLSQLELPLEEFEGKVNKNKLKLVLTNGKIQG